MARQVAEGSRFFRSLRACRVVPGPEHRALRAAVRSLAAADVLPGPLDYEVAIPPVHWAWCRRVAGCNLWLFYRVKGDLAYVLFVTRSPPVPVERGP